MAGVPQIAANVMHAAQTVHQAAQAAPVPTTVQGWTASTYILAIIALMNAGLITWLKMRGGWKKNELDADEKLRSEMWKDIEALKVSKEAQSRRITLAETRIQGQAIEIGQLRFVLKLLNDEIETVSPGNVIARQCRELLRNIQPSAMPSPEEIAPLADVLSKMCKDGEEEDGNP